MSPRKRIKAETFDKMQYFYSSVHHPLIRCLMRMDGPLDAAVLKKAVDLSRKAVPLLSCCFYAGAWKACWVDRGFTSEDIVRVVHAQPDAGLQTSRLLAHTIDILSESPLKIFLIKGRDADSLCIIVHHMLCDASGFREYLYLLADLYTKAEAGSAPELTPKARNASLLYSGLGLREKLKILFSTETLPGREEQLSFPLEGNGDTPEFLTRIILKRDMERMKEYGRSRNATVNDMLLTAYLRALRKELGRNRMTIPCPVDLRKFLPDNCEYGITNFTSNYLCLVDIAERETFSDTLAKVSTQMARQKSNNVCLKGILLLDILFRCTPFFLLKRIFPKIFTIPVVSYSNLGIISAEKLCFGNRGARKAFMTAAVKRAPYFQLTACTFGGDCAISSNLFLNKQDKQRVEHFLSDVKYELTHTVDSTGMPNYGICADVNKM